MERREVKDSTAVCCVIGRNVILKGDDVLIIRHTKQIRTHSTFFLEAYLVTEVIDLPTRIKNTALKI